MSDDAESMRQYMKLWLERAKDVSVLVPDVLRLSDQVDWQARAWTAIGSSSGGALQSEVDARLNNVYSAMRAQLPLPPAYASIGSTTVNTVIASGTMIIYNALIQCDAARVVPPTVAEPLIDSYRRLQDSSQRERETRARLAATFPATLSRFDSAANALQQARAMPDAVPNAALESRILLDALQGELFFAARQHPSENMTWATMSNRLGAIPTPVAGCQLLLAQGADRSSVYGLLSGVAKRRTEATSRDIAMLWPLVLDHIYVVCGSIAERDGTQPAS